MNFCEKCDILYAKWHENLWRDATMQDTRARAFLIRNSRFKGLKCFYTIGKERTN